MKAMKTKQIRVYMYPYNIRIFYNNKLFDMHGLKHGANIFFTALCRHVNVTSSIKIFRLISKY